MLWFLPSQDIPGLPSKCMKSQWKLWSCSRSRSWTNSLVHHAVMQTAEDKIIYKTEPSSFPTALWMETRMMKLWLNAVTTSLWATFVKIKMTWLSAVYVLIYLFIHFLVLLAAGQNFADCENIRACQSLSLIQLCVPERTPKTGLSAWFERGRVCRNDCCHCIKLWTLLFFFF